MSGRDGGMQARRVGGVLVTRGNLQSGGGVSVVVAGSVGAKPDEYESLLGVATEAANFQAMPIATGIKNELSTYTRGGKREGFKLICVEAALLQEWTVKGLGEGLELLRRHLLLQFVGGGRVCAISRGSFRVGNLLDGRRKSHSRC